MWKNPNWKICYFHTHYWKVCYTHLFIRHNQLYQNSKAENMRQLENIVWLSGNHWLFYAPFFTTWKGLCFLGHRIGLSPHMWGDKSCSDIVNCGLQYHKHQEVNQTYFDAKHAIFLYKMLHSDFYSHKLQFTSPHIISLLHCLTPTFLLLSIRATCHHY